MLRVLLPTLVLLATLAPAAPAEGATVEIAIPIDTILRGPEGSVAVATLATVAVDPELIGSECSVAGTAENQTSVHLDTDILVSSGGGQVVIPDVEREPNFYIVADGTLTLGPEIVVEVRFGPDRAFSAGMTVILTCTTPPVEVSVSVVAGVCVPETNVTPVVVVIDPASSATVTIEGPGGPYVVSGAGGTVEVGPGDYSWSAVADEGFAVVGDASGVFSTVDCTEEPAEVCDASVGDFVWFDTNADGVQQPSELGVAGVTVELLADGTVVASTSTDADGRYQFSDLCAGTYQVRFGLPDIPGMDNEAWSPAGAGDAETDSDAGDDGLTPAFDLAPGDNDLSWDAGLFAVAVAPTQITPPAPAQTELPMTGVSTRAMALMAMALLVGGAKLVRKGIEPTGS